jgi:hypothetical protein
MFVSDLRQVGGFLRVFRFPPTITLNQRYIEGEQEDDDIHELQIEDQRLEPSQSNNQINKLENINEQKSTLRHRKNSKRRNKNNRRLRKRRRRQKCLR